MKLHRIVSLFAASAALLIWTSSPAFSADAKPAKPVEKAAEKAEEAKPKRDWYPFAGVVASVDAKARTISLKRKDGDRALRVDAKSELEAAGKTITLTDVKTGSYAHGKLHKDASGREVVTSAKFDKEAPKHDKEHEEAPKHDKPAAKIK